VAPCQLQYSRWEIKSGGMYTAKLIVYVINIVSSRYSVVLISEIDVGNSLYNLYFQSQFNKKD